jgi:hypothetical protein
MAGGHNLSQHRHQVGTHSHSVTKKINFWQAFSEKAQDESHVSDGYRAVTAWRIQNVRPRRSASGRAQDGTGTACFDWAHQPAGNGRTDPVINMLWLVSAVITCIMGADCRQRRPRRHRRSHRTLMCWRATPASCIESTGDFELGLLYIQSFTPKSS